MEGELRAQSLRARGTVVWPPRTTTTTIRTGGRQDIILRPTQHRHGVQRNTEDFETIVETHGEERSDGTYYTKFAIDGHVYRVDDEIAIEAEDGDEVFMRIASLWFDRSSRMNMISLAYEDADEDDEDVEEEIENLKNVRSAAQARAARAAAAEPEPSATSACSASTYCTSAYCTSDLWLGMPQAAWRTYDDDFDTIRPKPRSAWLVQPPTAIANADTPTRGHLTFLGQPFLHQWMRLMHQFGMNAKCLALCLDRSRPWQGDRDYEIRACSKDQRRQLALLRELEAEATAHMEGHASGGTEAAAAEAAAAASVDAAIADVKRHDAAAAPPPPAPPRYTRSLAGLDISTEVERPTRLLPGQVAKLKVYGARDASGWRRSDAFPECEFHCEHKLEEEAHGTVYYVAVRSAGSSASPQPVNKSARRMQAAPKGKAKAVEKPVEEPMAVEERPPAPAAKASKGKAKAVVEVVEEAAPPAAAPAQPAKAPKGKAKAPKTYPAAIVAVVTTHGLLSRAAVTKQAGALGFDKASQITTALKKVLKDGLIKASGGSYTLGAAARAQLTPEAAAEYEAALERANGERKTKRAEKEDSRARADAKYAANLRAAGGLTIQAKQDRAWLQSVYQRPVSGPVRGAAR